MTTIVHADGKHVGPAQIRKVGDRLVVLCPLGHVVAAHPSDETFGGSAFEARVAFGWGDVECEGALPKAAA